MNDCSEALLGDRVEADDATVESLEVLEKDFLRTPHVHQVDLVVVRLHVVAWIGNIVQKVNKCKVNSFLLKLFCRKNKNCVPDMVELLCVALFENFLHEEVRLRRTSQNVLVWLQ